MPRLLVSVRSAEEARAALRGGADLIDVKEPKAGALGAAPPDVWSAVLAEVNQTRPVSAAIGELREDLSLLRSRARAAGGLTFVKVGLAGEAFDQNWPQRWRALQRALPAGTSMVAVIYADHLRAGAPLPHQILHECGAMNCRWTLIDTFEKSSGGLLDVISNSALSEIVGSARARQMHIVLAGSLTLVDVPRVAVHRPDYIGVRSAACSGGRDGQVDEGLVSQLSSGLHEFLSTTTNHFKKRFPVA